MNREELRQVLEAAPAGADRQAFCGNHFGQMFGWITAPDQAFLCDFLPTVGLPAPDPLRIVEIGTFGGSTARGLIALTGGGEVTCVDDFYDFRHHEGRPGRSPMLNDAPDGAAYFAATLKGPPDLSSYATLIQAPSTAHPSCRCCPPIAKPAAESWTQPIDLLFVDGDHSYLGALSDLGSFGRHVVPGGHCLVDDFHMPEVAKACALYFHRGAWDAVRVPRDPGDRPPPYGPLEGHIAVWRRR